MPPYVARSEGQHDRTVVINRLMRDGWAWIPGEHPERWERRDRSGDLTLIMTQREGEPSRQRGRPTVEFAVRSEPELELYALADATWADWDQRGRLVLAQQGRLLSWEPPNTFTTIADLTSQVPESIEAPDWARS
jgi:hypothetical protein